MHFLPAFSIIAALAALTRANPIPCISPPGSESPNCGGGANHVTWSNGALNVGGGWYDIIGGYTFWFQPDVNFVVYTGDPTPGGVDWQAGTGGRTCESCNLVYQGDGNLVIYNDGAPIWASMTQGQGESVTFISESPWVYVTNADGIVIWTALDGNRYKA